ncbi:DEAD/DEAH box helicase [Bacillus toyonensis]|uniref:DEAD/DEAH box helicase n=2 Tax=Bacillus cereus group TaxID=86661 RepID=UPI000BEDF7E6|nr:DEAD/DEAH box helicase family protein [Bacillus toyonensis]PDZ33700.1 restriction endonuclease subunit R [Bacillus toyonensis]PEI55401.1 restriction endonuclease subunit R [Bacillus toyonensis]PEJ12874.1 restriction endonuclease subunit R [Bacillus toyonensis]PGE75273.1 restriction endonuclease subunit R [Bacillus toyonensis]
MAFNYNPNHFLDTKPFIYQNEYLREPQIQGYYHVYEHFMIKQKTSHAVMVLPTGVGKTGIMALLPYGISKGRVLIIAPQIVIKETVIDALNPILPDNFWLKRKVLDRPNDLPSLIEFEGKKTKREVLEAANIVVVNIQKLQSRLDSSPLNFLPDDFFDLILIDEAHHSVAKTWVETTQYFSKAKVVKVTGTPFRTDNEKIAGELVYKYKLSQAMANGYVKSLENFEYIPEKLYLTIDGDRTKKYTVEEIYKLGLKDEEWVSRSVAYSPECSKSVVQKSIELLEEKLRNTQVPHKIIAVASDIKHAQEIEMLYNEKGYSTAIVHSGLPEEQKEKALNDIKNHRVKVVINVSMLGEGYDHPYLSIAAIFRAFRNPLPYAQFVGRILRSIPQDEVKKASDNIGQIVAHKHLALDELWEYYKTEIQESEVIQHLKAYDSLDSTEETNKQSSSSTPTKNHDDSIGQATEIGEGTLIGDAYLTTKLIEQKKKEDREREQKIIDIQKLLNLERKEAERILNQASVEQSVIKRPDLYFESKRKDIDITIKEKIVPDLLVKFSIDKKGNDLKNIGLFRQQYTWIPKKIKDNGGMLAVYFSTYLKSEIGASKDNWTIDDYDIAYEKLPQIVEYVEKVIEDNINS